MYELIAGVITLCIMVMKLYVNNQEQRRKAPELEKYEDDLKKFDAALRDGNPDALSLLFDELRIPGEIKSPGNPDLGGTGDGLTPGLDVQSDKGLGP
jgi:hypothetical protein